MGYAIAALVLTILQFLPVSMAFAQTSSCSAMTPGQLTSLNGFVPFAPSSLWNTDISNAPVDANLEQSHQLHRSERQTSS